MRELGENVFSLKFRGCIGIHKGPYIIDERSSDILCGTCKEHLNPIAVLTEYARKENAISYRFEQLKLEMEKAKFKAERQNRVRCEHCKKLTKIRKGGGG